MKAAFVSSVWAAVTGEEDVGGPISAARPDFLTTLRCQKAVQCLFGWSFFNYHPLTKFLLEVFKMFVNWSMSFDSCQLAIFRPFFFSIWCKIGWDNWDIHFFDLDLAIGLQCRLRGAVIGLCDYTKLGCKKHWFGPFLSKKEPFRYRKVTWQIGRVDRKWKSSRFW